MLKSKVSRVLFPMKPYLRAFVLAVPPARNALPLVLSGLTLQAFLKRFGPKLPLASLSFQHLLPALFICQSHPV